MSEKKVFFGPFEVVETEDVGKTAGGKNVIRLTFKERSVKEVVPQHIFELCASEKALDFTALRVKRYAHLINEIAAVCLESDIRFEDMKYVLQSVGEKFEAGLDRASNFLWTGNDKAWNPGTNYFLERTLLETDAVLKTIPKDESGEAKGDA